MYNSRLTNKLQEFTNKENFLAGSIIVDGTQVSVPLDSQASQLNPDYHRILFEDTFNCDPQTQIPASEEECSMTKVLAQAAARLLIKNFGMVTKDVDLDTECGFGNAYSF